ncbi:DNA polymerase III subunit gamma/tau, partial [Candidatus Acetothermia bacterium]
MDRGEGLSIYRRWRPQRFSEVVGQPLVTETLRRAVAQGKLAHAYLFSGQRGVGKTSVARILARAVNCLAPEEGEPCNRCDNCRRILAGKSLDVVEIDGASNRGIDQIRKLREEVGYVPAGAKYKVYIIDEVHMLTGEAFNALLKTLEEPPPHVIFIFATTEPHKVPSTVLSRCQAYEFSPVPEGLIQEKLLEIAASEGIALPREAAELIARRAGGSLRDAEVILEQLSQGGEVTPEAVVELLGLPRLEEVDRFLAALLGKDAEGALEVVEGLSARGRDLGLFLEEAAARARDRVIEGRGEFIPLARRLLELRAELPRAVSRKLHL